MITEASGLGKLIEGEQERDAVHIAVAPMEAGMELRRGWRVAVVDGKAMAHESGKDGAAGVVDPYLDADVVPAGARFWLFMFPGSITSLRHLWGHPALDPPPPSESQRWIEAFAKSLDQTYGRLMDAADAWLHGGDYTYDNSEAYKNHGDKFPEFWTHYAAVTGRDVSKRDGDHFFTCSC